MTALDHQADSAAARSDLGLTPCADGRQRMEAACPIGAIEPLALTLARRVIGQDEARDAIVRSFSRLLSGLSDPSRPLLTVLLLGPTGVGKTETARALAQALFDSDRALTRVSCETFANRHEVAKLLGSPPGYIGQQIEPLLAQRRIDTAHRQLREASPPVAGEREPTSLVDRIAAYRGDGAVSIVLFDEIEKAHPTVWNALLGVLDDGELTLGNNQTTDFTRSIIVLTSNVGSDEMDALLDPNPLGFAGRQAAVETARGDLDRVAIAAARKRFPPELMNRFDEVLVYAPLEREHLQGIFAKMLDDLHDRALEQAQLPMLVKVTAEAERWIIDRGTDPRHGARPLRRAVERELVDPLARLIASQQLEAGDVVDVDRENDALVFYRRMPAGGVVA